MKELASWLGQCELHDGVFLLASAYAQWVGAEVRGSQALFFTPPALATRVVRNLVANGVDFTKGRLMDPACGGAAFLAPAALQMRESLRKQGYSPRRILAHIQAYLCGVDLDETLCRLSAYFLKMTLYAEIVAAGYEPTFDVRQGDALADLNKLYGHVDVILCNPPYRKLSRAEARRYDKAFPSIIEGQSNLYATFFALVLKLLTPGGTAALLTGTSFLSGQNFSKLRTHLLENAVTKQIDVIGARKGIFFRVEQETAITVLTKQANKSPCTGETKIFSLVAGKQFKNLATCVLPNSGTAWPIPRSAKDAVVIRRANGSPFRLADYGYQVRIGAFVWNRDKRKTFVTEDDARKHAAGTVPLIWSSNIRPSGRFLFSNEKDDERGVFVEMTKCGAVSVLRRPCIAIQRVTSNDQPRRLVPAVIPKAFLRKHGGVLGENHVVFVEQIASKPALTPSALAKVLRSAPIDSLFRSISGSANVSIFELSQLPLPEPQQLAEQMQGHVDTDTAVMQAFDKQKKDLASKNGERREITNAVPI